ncbi:MAG: ATP-dependent helicase, partial [Nakamurella sp.]
MTATPVPATTDLATRLATLTLLDERRLRRRLRTARRNSDDAKRDRALADVERQVAAAEAKVARRQATVPTVRYPPELPVSDRADDLAAAIAANQVVIVAGETGSGKSTQLPKICLQIGRGVRGTIGHTQPRRIAARALAERIAEETGTTVGGAVGYAIRFGDHTGPNTLVKLMTDGILLNEIVRDRMLWAYDTIIIDEAHERSLNIDFLLGYLKELLPRRPDLKLIITSATIDPLRFSRHFGDA